MRYRYYNSDVHLLDLCIFSYHLHAQTLIWPMDPYYEQMEGVTDRRKRVMEKVYAKTANKTDVDGQGSCQGWPFNYPLDPIISEDARVYQWRPSFTRPTGT